LKQITETHFNWALNCI